MAPAFYFSMSGRTQFALSLCAVLLLLPLAGQLLIAQDVPQPSDAIVVIGGDHKPERMRRAAELYRDGLARRVILSAGTRVHEGGQWMPEAQVMLNQAKELGIPKDAIFLEQESQTTIQNAQYISSILEQKSIRSILLVTSPYHSRRARQIFSGVLGGRVSVRVQPGLDSGFCSICWLLQADQRSVVTYEYRQLLAYALLRH